MTPTYYHLKRSFRWFIPLRITFWTALFIFILHVIIEYRRFPIHLILLELFLAAVLLLDTIKYTKMNKPFLTWDGKFLTGMNHYGMKKYRISINDITQISFHNENARHGFIRIYFKDSYQDKVKTWMIFPYDFEKKDKILNLFKTLGEKKHIAQ